MNIVERRRAQDGQISMEIDGRSVDIRVATTAVIEGEKVVMRLLDKSRAALPARPARHAATTWSARYAGLLRAPYGMVICAGPTGSGKTTTLYGSLGEINSPERNVMTIEDPVEYRIPSINQIQINEQAGITFAGGLRSILRQDPDVILVGEIRDVETARIAVQAALTGHFVLSSLHATDAAAAAAPAAGHGNRGLPRRLLGDRRPLPAAGPPHLRALPRALRAVPARSSRCCVRSTAGRRWRASCAGTGCNFCAQTGFLERIGVYELMLVTDAIRDLVVDRRPHDEIRKVARSEGMRTLQRGGGPPGRVRRDHPGRGDAVHLRRGGLRCRSSRTWRPDPTGGAPTGVQRAATRDAAEHALYQRNLRGIRVTEKRSLLRPRSPDRRSSGTS